MRELLADIAAKPLIQRFVTIGVLTGSVVGGIVGLIRGLEVHPATAWFAVFELGVLVAIASGALGLGFGLLVTAARRIKRHGAVPPV
ncbi:MAG: hypothetical protein ACRDLT_05180 [Solirubrobacteraceae bacterium]